MVPAWIFHGWPEEAVAAARAAGMYGVALVGLRLASRRTLSQWTAIDVAASVVPTRSSSGSPRVARHAAGLQREPRWHPSTRDPERQ